VRIAVSADGGRVTTRGGNAHRSFEEYAGELRSGKLEWSPMHRSEVFWKQNAQRLNEQNYELLRILARLLSSSLDPTVLAVAAHDVGEYVSAYPRGKRIIQELGAKQRIMELMTNDNTTVRYEALLSTQKFMVNNWSAKRVVPHVPKRRC
jgi:V-type H+-transporting ATPase subunit H